MVRLLRSWWLTVLCCTCLSADFAPNLEWVKTIGGSGGATVAGAKADANGNLYIVGVTSSLDLPVKNAAQPNAGGSPLVRITSATGAVQKLYPPNLSNLSSLTADPRNPSTLYATVGNAVFQSADAGTTWSTLSIVGPGPSLTVNSVTVDPNNSTVLYATTNIQGVLKSTDSGHTWTAINNGIAPYSGSNNVAAFQVWVAPNSSQLLFAYTNDGIMRSADGGATWTVVIGNAPIFANAFSFDPFQTGIIYAGSLGGILKSTDGGQTFTAMSNLPESTTVWSLLADPHHSGVLFAGTSSGVFESIDAGVNWTQKISASALSFPYSMAADPNNSLLYAIASYGIVKSADDFTTITPIGPPESPVQQVLVAGPYVFEVSQTTTDVFVAKLASNGDVVYATYFGGSAEDQAMAMALGPDGSVYVTGQTLSTDFPVTTGAYSKTANANGGNASFVFKLNPDRSIGWSTYFADARSSVQSIAVDSAGSVYIGGNSGGDLPTTPGAYQTQFTQTESCFLAEHHLCVFGPTSAFVTKFNAQGSQLVYSTYVPTDSANNSITTAAVLAIDSNGDVFFGGQGSVAELNASGSKLLAAIVQNGITVSALAIDADSNVYVTGNTNVYNGSAGPTFVFPATPGAFQTTPQPTIPALPGDYPAGGVADAFVIKWDKTLSKIQAATLLGGEQGDYGESIAIDSAGNIILSGSTASYAFPTHAPFQTSFYPGSGFVAGLDPTLSTLLFSTYLGDGRPFDAHAVTVDASGNVLMAGYTQTAGSQVVGGEFNPPYAGQQVFANKIALLPSPGVRLDSVQNFASHIAAPIAPGEPILAVGSGFGLDAQFVIDGVPLPTVSSTATNVVAVMPDSAVTAGAHLVQISSGGALSNSVYVPATLASPAIFSTNGSGYGQGYILNGDGTLNSPSNPASPGSPIIIFAIGVGAYSLVNGYAVTAQPPSVFVDGFYANGISATEGPVSNLPGNVYQLKVYVPDPASMANSDPNLQGFTFPPQVGVRLAIGPVPQGYPNGSPYFSQPGILLNVK